MHRHLMVGLCLLVAVSVSATPNDDVSAVVREAEQKFADTMARRDLAGFSACLAEEAVFMGGSSALRGRTAVSNAWEAFFTEPEAPFSWQPEVVQVLDSGTLAFSSGPVLAPTGERIGTFNSVWRLESDGQWRVVFDKGCPPCASVAAEEPEGHPAGQ